MTLVCRPLTKEETVKDNDQVDLQVYKIP